MKQIDDEKYEKLLLTLITFNSDNLRQNEKYMRDNKSRCKFIDTHIWFQSGIALIQTILIVLILIGIWV